ncbi:DoxX family protein [uncultured Bacteroides sp.]|uniref:DoxX family protein n=1 Tax=uncultured Bacteroides sp. TaxID=162156 RepID=UPI002AA6248E|nr:DoxX family protein [uncultured Bacteroides sp.]
MIYNFLFPEKLNDSKISLFLLAIRVLFGLLLVNHGLQKWNAFEQMAPVFPDPLGVGSSVSLTLAIFGELICSIAFIFGFLYRLSMIPMIITMSVAFFMIHTNDAFAVKEMAFIYLAVFILMYIVGPGKFAVDELLIKFLKKK